MSAGAIDFALGQRVSALYLPMMAALLLALGQRGGRPRPRRFAAGLLGFLWAMPTLLLLQRVNSFAAWWSYPQPGPRLCGMPLELYIGWLVLWGILPTLALSRIPLGWALALMAAFDLAAMPLCDRIVHLSAGWQWGEAAALALVLLPGLWLARWTELDAHLAARATLQVATAGLLFLYFVPELVFALRPGQGWAPLLRMPGWERQLGLAAVLACSLPGLGAAMEFAQRGQGTPIPYDPPRRLVTSGIYRYIANPMQLSCSLVMLLWAALLRNPWLPIPAGLAVVYSAGIARWDEQQDLARRFGKAWRNYRAEVHDWRFRALPYHAGPPASLYVATGCALCRELRRWIESRSPIGMEILPAESFRCSIERLPYDPNDGTPAVNGMRAMGRALEHLNLAWALAGTALRLPGVWLLVQLLMDTSGLGPRKLAPSKLNPTELAPPHPSQTHVH